MKYNKEALAAAGRYCSLASLILASVTLASFTCEHKQHKRGRLLSILTTIIIIRRTTTKPLSLGV